MTRAKDELYIFNCADKSSEFCAEIAGRLPVELVDENEVFAPLKAKLCGKSYSHSEKGKGIIKAQCGDRVLVYYPGHEPELYTLAQLMAERDMSVRYTQRKAEPETKPTAEAVKVSIGTKLRHKKFGEGVVLSVEKGIAKIMFSKEYGVKSIVLATGFNNGIISLV